MTKVPSYQKGRQRGSLRGSRQNSRLAEAYYDHHFLSAGCSTSQVEVILLEHTILVQRALPLLITASRPQLKEKPVTRPELFGGQAVAFCVYGSNRPLVPIVESVDLLFYLPGVWP